MERTLQSGGSQTTWVSGNESPKGTLANLTENMKAMADTFKEGLEEALEEAKKERNRD